MVKMDFSDWEKRSNRGARTDATDRTSLSFIRKARFPAILHACFPAILRARRQGWDKNVEHFFIF